MLSLYEILKASKTGIAPDMWTALAGKNWGGADSGHEVKELTGIPPLSFTADGTPLLDYLISGNMEQSGTPTPTTPIQPQETGERTGNLLNLNRTYSNSFTTDTTKWMNGAATKNNAGTAYAETEIIGDVIKVTSKTAGYGASFLIKASPNTTYTVSFETDKVSSGSWGAISTRDINGAVIEKSVIQGKSATFTTHDNCAFLNVCFRFPPADGTVTFSNIMLNVGSTPLPYEPYGYKLPISSAGQTNNIYLGEVVTTRYVKQLVLTGEENWIYDMNGSRCYINITGAYAKGDRRTQCYCSHYICVYNGEPFNTIPNHSIYINLYNKAARFYIKNEEFTSAADFKSFLAQQYAAGTPVTVWYVLAEPETGIVNEPLRKIGDYADTVSYEQAGVSIPTLNGQTVIDVDTALKPSEMYIKYKG